VTAAALLSCFESCFCRPNVSVYFHRMLSEIGADPAATQPSLLWDTSNHGQVWAAGCCGCYFSVSSFSLTYLLKFFR